MYPWELEKFAKTYLDDFIMLTPVDHHSSLFSGVKVVLHMKKKKEIEKKNDIKMSRTIGVQLLRRRVNSVEIRRQG